MKNTYKNNRGFTLVELVIVIAIIAVLAAVLIPTFSHVIKSGNETAATKSADPIYVNIVSFGGDASFGAGLEKIVSEMKTKDATYTANEDGTYTLTKTQLTGLTEDAFGVGKDIDEISISSDYSTLTYTYKKYKVTVKSEAGAINTSIEKI